MNPLPTLRLYWAELRSSLWFVPALLVLAAVGAALLMIHLDVRLAASRSGPPPLGIGAAGARGVLGTIAGSIITVAGVAFSITIVALSLTASQYSSRVLRNFMRDRTSQRVLGVLVGTFAYCLVVLRTVRGGDEHIFVPALAVSGGVILALVAIATFVYFIHHIATAIQASTIVANVAEETLAAVDVIFPEALGDEPAEDAIDAGASIPVGPWRPVLAGRSGYVRHVDCEALLAFARERGVVVRMEHAVGDFAIEGTALVSLAGGADVDDATAERVNRIFILDHYRTTEQDLGYGVRQMVDVALRALSPGINDTTTAIMCVDWLTAVLRRVAERRIPSRARLEDGVLRVIARGPTFESLTRQAFDQIRQHAAGNEAVLLRQSHHLESLLPLCRSSAQRHVLRQELALVAAVAAHSIPLAADRVAIAAVAQRCAATP